MAGKFPTLGLEVVLRGVGQYAAGAGTIFATNKKLAASVSKTATALGTKLSLGLTLPIIGMGLAISKFGLDFEKELTNIDALTATTGEGVDEMRGQILDLSRSLGKGPAELAAGAYFILSSGITETAEAMKVLEIAGKASATGLGETKTIADVLTSVLNAYQLSADKAGQVTDTLLNIVKLGKGEPAEFANSIGFVIPLAAQMGVEFEELGAVLATLTNTGLDAAESTTALRGILAQLLSPTKEAEEVFKAMGTTVGDFRDLVKKDFIGAMEALAAATLGNEEVFAKLFPDIRGLTGVLAAFGNQADQTRANMDGIRDGAGALDEAFAVVEKSPEFKIQKALNDLKVSLTELGIDLLPTLISLLEDAQPVLRGFGKAVQAFSDLPAPIRTAVLALVAFLAVAGPLLLIVGVLASAFGFLLPVIGFLAGAFGLLGAAVATFGVGGLIALLLPVILVIAALVALGVAVLLVIKYWDQIMAAGGKVIEFFKDNWQIITALLLAPFIVGPLLIAKLMVANASKITGAAGRVIDFFQDDWQLIAKILAAPFTLGLSLIIPFLIGQRSGIFTFFRGMMKAVFKFGAEIPSLMARGLSSAAGSFFDVLNDFVGEIIKELNPFNWVFGSDIVDVYRKAGQEAGDGLVERLEVALARATGIPDRVFGDIIQSARNFVDNLQSELGRLLSMPTIESAGRNLKLSKLRLQEFKLRSRVDTGELEEERSALEEEQATTARGNVERQATINQRLQEIAIIENQVKKKDKELEVIRDQIEELERLEERRRLELDVLRARGVVADRTLLTDFQLNSAIERMIGLVGTATAKIATQAGVIRSQYIPSLNDAAGAVDGVDVEGLGFDVGQLTDGLGSLNPELDTFTQRLKDAQLANGEFDLVKLQGIAFAANTIAERLAIAMALGQDVVDLQAIAFGLEQGAAPTRQHGGPVRAGMPYIVGERRPEVFVPSISGAIMPSMQSFFGKLVAAMQPAAMSEGGGFKNFGTQIFNAGEDSYSRDLVSSMVRAAGG